jgi:hypothetical protein
MSKRFIIKISFFGKEEENVEIHDDVDNIQALKLALETIKPEDNDKIIGIRFSYISPE